MTEIGIYDHTTGKQSVREMDAEELALHEASVIENAALIGQQEAAKATAHAKLAKLGLTTDDLEALGL